jgi:hypothetical protein
MVRLVAVGPDGMLAASRTEGAQATRADTVRMTKAIIAVARANPVSCFSAMEVGPMVPST